MDSSKVPGRRGFAPAGYYVIGVSPERVAQARAKRESYLAKRAAAEVLAAQEGRKVSGRKPSAEIKALSPMPACSDPMYSRQAAEDLAALCRKQGWTSVQVVEPVRA